MLAAIMADARASGRAAVERLVLAAVDAVNASAPDDRRVPKDLQAPLVGRGGVLDSLGLVGLLVAIEERLQDELGATLTLADDRAFARERTPFRTLSTLIDYTTERLQEHGNG